MIPMASLVDKMAKWEMGPQYPDDAQVTVAGPPYVVWSNQRKYIQEREMKSWWPSPWNRDLGKHFFDSF